MRHDIPPKDVFAGTPRQWKQLKRKEWRDVMRAAHTFLLASAWTPAD
jgi:hypothetical protein